MSSSPKIPKLPHDIETIDPSSLSGINDTGTQEGKFLGRGKTSEQLEAEARENNHRRTQNFLNVFEWGSLILLIASFVFVLAIGAVWVWHLVSPENWHYLSQIQVDKIQSIVTGSIVTNLAVSHLQKRLSKE